MLPGKASSGIGIVCSTGESDPSGFPLMDCAALFHSLFRCLDFLRSVPLSLPQNICSAKCGEAVFWVVMAGKCSIT